MLKQISFNSSKKSVKVSVSLGALLLALGATGEETGDLANGEKMQIIARLVRAGVTGSLILNADEPKMPHYTIEGANLVVYTKELPQGYNRLTINVQYGTNEVSSLLVDINVLPGATDGEQTEEIALDAVKTVGGAGGGGMQQYILGLSNGHITHDGQPLTFAEVKEAVEDTSKFVYLDFANALHLPCFIVDAEGNSAVAFSAAFQVGGAPYIERVAINENEEVKIDNMQCVSTDGDAIAFNTYADKDERIMVQREEDGSTVIYDQHENPIIRRTADGITQVLDAYQSVRVQVEASGEFSVLNNNGHKVIENHDNTVSLREDNGQERIVLRSDNGEVYINGADGSHKAIDITHGAPGYESTQPTLTLSGQKVEIKQLNKIIFSSDYTSNRDVILGTAANGAGDGKIIYCSGSDTHLTLFSGNTTYGRGSIVLTAEDLTKLRAILNREPSVASVGQYINEYSKYYDENGNPIEGDNAGIGGFEQPTPDRNDGATPVETFDYPLD